LLAIGPWVILAVVMTRTRQRGVWFWVVALAFTTAMAFTTVPTPLWSMCAQRDRFSSLTVTIAFAVYALAVAASLFLAGHLSDWHGRRRVLTAAFALEIVAGVVFIAAPTLPGLLLARVLSGLGIGAVTATSMAWLSELHGGNGRRAQIVATGANLGGLGLGGLISGALAQWAPDALVVPYVVFTAALLLSWGALVAAPRRVPGVRRARATGRASRCRRTPAAGSSPPPSAPRSRSRSSGCSPRWSEASSPERCITPDMRSPAPCHSRRSPPPRSRRRWRRRARRGSC
jgi:MFS family permease